MEPLPLSAESLDPRFVFLLDTGKTIWIWTGRKARVKVKIIGSDQLMYWSQILCIKFFRINFSYNFESFVYLLQITVSNKARLFAVKINKHDRKGVSEIETCNELKTPPEFWMALTGKF